MVAVNRFDRHRFDRQLDFSVSVTLVGREADRVLRELANNAPFVNHRTTEASSAGAKECVQWEA
jgi:hypothetical protein